MREPGFDEFADLWNEPDPGEKEEFERMARRARLHGRFLAYADFALGFLVLCGAVFGMMMTPHPLTMAAGLALVAITVWVSMKRRQMRQMTAALNTADRSSFITSSIRHARANLRRVEFTLAVVPLFVVGSVLFKLSLRSGGPLMHPLDALVSWASSTRGMVTLSVISVVIAFTWRSRLRLKAEVRRLEEIRTGDEEIDPEA